MKEPSSILVVLGGHSESHVKYAEFFYDLKDLPVSIYALDQRGQGEARHARKLQDYVDYPEIRLGYPTVHWAPGDERDGGGGAIESLFHKSPGSGSQGGRGRLHRRGRG
jgi:hypothetical protein